MGLLSSYLIALGQGLIDGIARYLFCSRNRCRFDILPRTRSIKMKGRIPGCAILRTTQVAELRSSPWPRQRECTILGLSFFGPSRPVHVIRRPGNYARNLGIALFVAMSSDEYCKRPECGGIWDCVHSIMAQGGRKQHVERRKVPRII